MSDDLIRRHNLYRFAPHYAKITEVRKTRRPEVLIIKAITGSGSRSFRNWIVVNLETGRRHNHTTLKGARETAPWIR